MKLSRLEAKVLLQCVKDRLAKEPSMAEGLVLERLQASLKASSARKKQKKRGPSRKGDRPLDDSSEWERLLDGTYTKRGPDGTVWHKSYDAARKPSFSAMPAVTVEGGQTTIRGGLGLLRRAKAICEEDGRSWKEITPDVMDQYINLARGSEVAVKTVTDEGMELRLTTGACSK